MPRIGTQNVWKVVGELTPEQVAVLFADAGRCCQRLCRWYPAAPDEVALVFELAVRDSEDPRPYSTPPAPEIDFAAFRAEFARHLPAAVRYATKDERHVGPCRQFRHMKRGGELALGQIEAKGRAPDELAADKEWIARADAHVPTMEVNLQAPARWWLVDLTGVPAPGYQELGIPHATWYVRLRKAEAILLAL